MLTKEQLKQSQALESVILEANQQLLHTQDQNTQKYITKRGLNEKIITHFKLGFIPRKFSDDPLNSFSCVAIKKHHPDWTNEQIVSLAMKNNLIKKITTSKGDAFIETYSNRLLYPFTDKDNHIVGLTARDIPQPNPKTDQKLAKYINTPENDLFHKREIFFNYGPVKARYNSTQALVLCEGVMDVTAYEKAGINALAGSGIALSQEQVDMIKALKAKEIILSYDNDMAGKDAMARNYSLLQQNGLDVKFINYGDIQLKDMDDIVNNPKYGPKTIQKLVSTPQSEMDFLFKYFVAQKTLQEEKIPGTQTKKITYKPISQLSDLEQYNLVFDTFKFFAHNHNYEKNNYRLPKKEYFKFKDALAKKLEITPSEAQQLILSFIALDKQKPKRKIKMIKTSKKDRASINFEAFENEDTMHFIMDKIGAQASHKRNFYHSPWNSDDDASFSIKRGTGMWSDFSAGRSGGPFQLLCYCDLSDPEHPVVTDNDKQSTYAQAYNWLIKVMKSDLQPTAQTDTFASYAFDPEQKKKIAAISQAFKHIDIIAADNDFEDEQGANKKLLAKFYPQYLKPYDKQSLPPFITPIKHSGCSYPIYDLALMTLTNSSPRIVSVHPESKYFPYFDSTKNPQALTCCFSLEADKFFDLKKANLDQNLFVLPKEIKPNQLKDILSNNYITVNFEKPSAEFLKTNFTTLSKCQKQIFVENQDLYNYCIKNKILPAIDIVKALANDNPTSLFKDNVFKTAGVINKKHSNYYKTIFNNVLKENNYPPIH